MASLITENTKPVCQDFMGGQNAFSLAQALKDWTLPEKIRTHFKQRLN